MTTALVFKAFKIKMIFLKRNLMLCHIIFQCLDAHTVFIMILRPHNKPKFLTSMLFMHMRDHFADRFIIMYTNIIKIFNFTGNRYHRPARLFCRFYHVITYTRTLNIINIQYDSIKLAQVRKPVYVIFTFIIVSVTTPFTRTVKDVQIRFFSGLPKSLQNACRPCISKKPLPSVHEQRDPFHDFLLYPVLLFQQKAIISTAAESATSPQANFKCEGFCCCKCHRYESINLMILTDSYAI